MPIARKIPDQAIQLIKHFEGCSLRAYQDPVGVWTIGYGHTGSQAYPGNMISHGLAEELLQRDIDRAALEVETWLPGVPLTDNQFGALVSFMFNLGRKKLTPSTIQKMLLARDYEAAAQQFVRWVYGKQNGQYVVLPGLERRRKAEQTLFLAP